MGPRLCRRGNADLLHDGLDEGIASMGPRLCRRGNVARHYLAGCGNTKLQWGHVFVDVEILLCHSVATKT